MYRKRMSEALQEARAYRDPVNEDRGFSSQQIKMAYGVLNDPRYKQGNYSGAVRAIEKIARGLSNHPDVKNALKRANEELEEASKYLRYSDLLIQKGRMQKAGDKQGERLTDIEIEKEKKKLGIKDEFIPEGMMKRLIGAVQDKLSKEGGAAGFADLAKAAKSMGVTLTKDMLKDMPGVKQHRDGDYILEETITEFKKMVVTIADPMKRAKAMDDIKRFGKSTGFRIDKMSDGKSFRIDGKGADLNKFAIDMKNYYGATIKAESLEEAFTLADYRKLEADNQHAEAAAKLVNQYGTPEEKKEIAAINARHKKTGYISGPDFKRRVQISNKYYSRLK